MTAEFTLRTLISKQRAKARLVTDLIMQEAVRRGFIDANPCLRLGLKRTPPKKEPEINAEEITIIEEALKTRDKWMAECWLVAMRQGCRLTETAVPLANIDTESATITFHAKGGRVHPAPLHPDLIPFVDKARNFRRKTLVELPEYAAKKWLGAVLSSPPAETLGAPSTIPGPTQP